MSTDYRALCAELLAALDRQAATDPEADGGLLRHRARAALAQPELVGPTDEKLDELYFDIDATSVSHGSPLPAPFSPAGAVLPSPPSR
jgi:hypothetical protein